ncbi:MAG TPA: HdeD family acid-resistance protein [Paenalcaligenes sp.]|nr:HdeD family acid-resistance protein [Paenalcaligenes sp.]
MANQFPSQFPDKPELAAALKKVASRWGWFVGVGILLLILGVIASLHIFMAAVVSVWFIGLLMIFGGVAQLIHAWRTGPWTSFILWSLSGLLYLAGGVIAFVNPMLGAMVLTLLLGASLIGLGALRLWIWFNNRAQPGWGWLAFSGLISVLAGLLIAWGWPENSMFIMGILLAIDILFQGWALLFLGLALKNQV